MKIFIILLVAVWDTRLYCDYTSVRTITRPNKLAHFTGKTDGDAV